jgi:hypothetical protein
MMKVRLVPIRVGDLKRMPLTGKAACQQGSERQMNEFAGPFLKIYEHDGRSVPAASALFAKRQAAPDAKRLVWFATPSPPRTSVGAGIQRQARQPPAPGGWQLSSTVARTIARPQIS